MPAWWCFFGCWLSIGPMADDSHHGEGEHDEGDMAVPAMPGAGLVMIEAELILGSLKTILNGPAMTFHRHQLLDGRAFGTPCGEEGQAAIGNVAADQKTPRAFPGKIAVVFAGVEIGPARDRPSRASVDLWSLRRTASGARPFWEGSARSRRRRRRWTAACPRNGRRDWKQHPEHSLCPPCAAGFRSLPCHTRCLPPRTRTVPLRRSRERSFDARSWAS